MTNDDVKALIELWRESARKSISDTAASIWEECANDLEALAFPPPPSESERC